MQPALTAAGHDGAQQGEGLFIKPSSRQEIDFYQWLTTHPTSLNEFVPQFMGTLVEGRPPAAVGTSAGPEPLSSSNNLPAQTADPRAQPLLVLEDLCAGFHSPSVMDVKLGRQLWDAATPPAKRERLQNVAATTTSGALGYRIAGLSFINNAGERENIGKQFGRAATAETIEEHLAVFWPQIANEYVRDACLAGIIARLEDLHAALSEQRLEMHSASVLLLYEGDLKTLVETTDKLMAEDDVPEEINSSEDESFEPRILDVRLIDFAHATQANCPDKDTLSGLSNLIAALKNLLAANADR